MSIEKSISFEIKFSGLINKDPLKYSDLTEEKQIATIQRVRRVPLYNNVGYASLLTGNAGENHFEIRNAF